MHSVYLRVGKTLIPHIQAQWVPQGKTLVSYLMHSAYLRVGEDLQVPPVQLYHWPLLHVHQDLVQRFVAVALGEGEGSLGGYGPPGKTCSTCVPYCYRRNCHYVQVHALMSSRLDAHVFL